MNKKETEPVSKVEELIKLRSELTEYFGYVGKVAQDDSLTKEKESRASQLFHSIGYKSGYLGKLITDLTHEDKVKVGGTPYNMWSVALRIPVDKLAWHGVGFCIQVLNRTIGKLKDDIEKGIRDEQGNMIEKAPELSKKPAEVIGELPIQLFDAMQLHPKVVKASKSCFTTSNYREAILNAFISLIDYIKEISGLDLDGDDLMNNAFSFNYDKEQKKITRYPIICINELKNRTDRDEQQGFMFLCKGAAAFVRNPKAHKLIIQTNPLHTLEYLAFASLLFRRFDEWEDTHTIT